MRNLTTCFLIGTLSICTAEAQTQPPYAWSKTCTKWHYSSDNSKHPQPVYATSVAAPGSCPGYDGTEIAFKGCNPAPNTWNVVDLTQFQVPVSAVEADLAGVLIITPGTVAGTPFVGITFRAPGSTAMPKDGYQGYTVGQSGPATMGINGQQNAGFVGARAPFSIRVPVVNGKIEYSWNYHTTSATTTTEAYAINMSLVGWCD